MREKKKICSRAFGLCRFYLRYQQTFRVKLSASKDEKNYISRRNGLILSVSAKNFNCHYLTKNKLN